MDVLKSFSLAKNWATKIIQKQIKAELFLILAALLWGGSFPATKLALESFSATGIIFWRFGLSALILGPFVFFKFPLPKSAFLQELKTGLFLGVIMFIGFAAQTVGLELTTPGKSGFIAYTFAVIVPFLQFFLLKRPPKKKNILGIILVCPGMFLFSNPGSGNFNIGDLITFGSAIGYAFYIIALDVYAKQINPFRLAVYQFVAATLLSAGCAFLLGQPLLPDLQGPVDTFSRTGSEVSVASILSMAYLAGFCTLLAMTLLTLFQKDTTPVKAVIIYSLEPVASFIISAFMLSEPFGFLTIVGAGLILGGVLVSEMRLKQKVNAI